MGIARRTPVHQRRWNVAEEGSIRRYGRHHYPAGFHVWLERPAACWGSGELWRVAFSDVRASGTEPNGLRTVVVGKMKLVERLWPYPEEKRVTP
jgi:hypothetical protein